MAQLEPIPDPLIGVSLGGRYRLVRKLGEGAMGAVYEARDAEGAVRAVKIMHPEGDQSSLSVTRFVNEARATASLRSPHVVSVFDGGMDEATRTPYLVMEMLQGFDAEQLLERVGPLEPMVAVRLVIQACHGVAAAHTSGIIHRDIKPSNLFLETRPDGTINVKVCDFGTAKLTTQGNAQITRTGAFMGSPLYMSPEQAKSSKHVDERADVWSLGVTLYSLLCGHTPNESATSLADLLTKICTLDTPPLQDFAPWVEPGLAAVVHAALLRDLDSRWPSVAKFSRALLSHAQGDVRLTRDLLIGVSAETRSRQAARGAIPTNAPRGSVRPHAGQTQDRLIGSVLAGKYRLVRELGRGGMGAVYEAVDAAGKRYAIKVVLDEATKSPDALRRFVREARASTEIVSPNVVAVVDADTDMVNQAPFIVMELLSGMDLDNLIENVGPLDPTAAARAFRQACVGLGAAHARSIVHRDIKPANIFLDTKESGEVIVKICDFGIAKRTATEAINQSTAGLTATGGLLGSPVYMSPEQARNAKHVDLRTDVWSLSMSLYEALSGKRPWSHCTTVGELILAICTEDIPPLAHMAPWVDPKLAAVVEKGLRRDVAQRWTTVEQLHAALAPFTGGSDALTKSSLVGVPADVRYTSVQRMVDTGADTIAAAGASARGMAISTMGSAAVETVRRPATGGTSRAMIIGSTAAALLAAAAGVFVYTRRQAPPPEPAVAAAAPLPSPAAPPVAVPAPAPAPTPSAVPAKMTSKIIIAPPTATVEVDGVAQTLDNGVLSFPAEPGDTFTVVASFNGVKIEKRVSILKGGIAEPNTITVPARKAAAARPAGGKTTTTAAQPAAVTAPKTAAPKIQNDW